MKRKVKLENFSNAKTTIDRTGSILNVSRSLLAKLDLGKRWIWIVTSKNIFHPSSRRDGIQSTLAQDILLNESDKIIFNHNLYGFVTVLSMFCQSLCHRFRHSFVTALPQFCNSFFHSVCHRFRHILSQFCHSFFKELPN